MISRWSTLFLAVPFSLVVACGGDNNDNNPANNTTANNTTVNNTTVNNTTVNNTTANNTTANNTTANNTTANNTTVNNTTVNNTTGPGSIVDVASEAGFTTLLGAATTAGLADTLATGGPFTVFAPTDEAFAALGDAVPSDAGLLANVLLHHVVAGSQDSGAVVAAGMLTTLANTTLTVDASGSPITVNGFALSATLDVEASNGIIHVLDEVIVPPTILEAAAATPDLSTLVTAVGASSQGVQDTLASAGPLTVFAPANPAFAAIPEADLNALLADQAALDGVLTYHAAVGQALSTDLTDGQVITMASGGDVTVSVDGGAVSLTDAAGNTVNVVAADIRLLNGVVHVIDGVLMPQ